LSQKTHHGKPLLSQTPYVEDINFCKNKNTPKHNLKLIFEKIIVWSQALLCAKLVQS
jgi:hypothetical protein